MKISGISLFKLMAFISTIILFFVSNFSEAKLKYHYDQCDPKWANDTLWLNFVFQTQATICKDELTMNDKYPLGFVALVASAFANRNISCGEGRVCDPAVLNRDLIRCYHFIHNKEYNNKNKTLFQCIGLKFINETVRFQDIEDYVFDEYTLIAAHIYPNKTETNNRFLIEDTYEHYVRGVDYRGNYVVYPYSEIKGIEKFKILNVHKEKKKRNKNASETSTKENNSEATNTFTLTQESNINNNKELNQVIKNENNDNLTSNSEEPVNSQSLIENDSNNDNIHNSTNVQQSGDNTKNEDL